MNGCYLNGHHPIITQVGHKRFVLSVECRWFVTSSQNALRQQEQILDTQRRVWYDGGSRAGALTKALRQPALYCRVEVRTKSHVHN